MLTLTQCVSSAITNLEKYSIKIGDYNRRSFEITDYMMHANIACVDIGKYLAGLKALRPQLASIIETAIANGSTATMSDIYNLYHGLVREIYDRLVIAKMLPHETMMVGFEKIEAERFVSKYSDSLFSMMPGVSMLSVNAVGFVKEGSRLTTEGKYAVECEIYTSFCQRYIDLCIDPAFGKGQFGLMPYTMPTIPTSFESIVEANEDKFQYLELINKAREDFSNLLAISVDLRNIDKKLIEYDNTISDGDQNEESEYQDAVNIKNATKDAYDEYLSSMQVNLLSAFHNIAVSYNPTHRLYFG